MSVCSDNILLEGVIQRHLRILKYRYNEGNKTVSPSEKSLDGWTVERIKVHRKTLVTPANQKDPAQAATFILLQEMFQQETD